MLTRSAQGKHWQQLNGAMRPHLQLSRQKWMPLGSSSTPSAASIAQHRPASAGVDLWCVFVKGYVFSRIVMQPSYLMRTVLTSSRIAQSRAAQNSSTIRLVSVHTGCWRHTMQSSMSVSITCWPGRLSAAGSVTSSGDGARNSCGSGRPHTASCCECRANRCCSGCTGCTSSAMLGCGSRLLAMMSWQTGRKDVKRLMHMQW